MLCSVTCLFNDTWLVSLYESSCIFYEIFTLFQVVNYIFLCYQFLIISSKCSRLEDCNNSPNRVQNEQFVNDSQRKSKKTEKSGKKSNRPLLDENVSVLHHSKRSKEKSPSKKRSRSCSRSSRRKRSHLQPPRPGPSC